MYLSKIFAMWTTPQLLEVNSMLNEIIISPGAFLVVLGIVALLGARYVTVIVNAIVNILRFLWWLIVLIVLGYAIYYVFSNMSIS